MPEFLAETYTPRAELGAAAPSAADGPGAAVCFLGAIAAPEEETCFWLFQAPSAEAVRAAMAAAGLRPERIIPAVTLRPPGPGRAGGAPPGGPPPPATTH
jgi:hypothetical protein